MQDVHGKLNPGLPWQNNIHKKKNIFTRKWALNLTLNLPTTTIIAQPFNIIKWQLKFNPVA